MTHHTAHIVGLKYYLPEPLLTSIMNHAEDSKIPLQGKLVYLMNDMECEQDDHAVMAYDECGSPLGHVSKMESAFYARMLGNEITASISDNNKMIDSYQSIF